MGADGSRPPELNLKLWRRIKILTFANIIPILIGLFLVFGYMTGSVRFKVSENLVLAILVTVMGSVLMVVMATWVLLPFSVWLRAYPLWHFQHISKLKWAIPTLLGYAAWLAIYLIGLALIIAALSLIVTGLWHLMFNAPRV